jgi:hypothetical protein
MYLSKIEVWWCVQKIIAKFSYLHVKEWNKKFDKEVSFTRKVFKHKFLAEHCLQLFYTKQ